MNKKICIVPLGLLAFLASCGTSIQDITVESGSVPLVDTTTKMQETTTIPETTTTTKTITTTTTMFPENKDYTYNEFIDVAFGSDQVIYNAGDSNPYGIDLTKYGNDISAIFYEPKDIDDPYMDVDYYEFYRNFNVAITYEDAYYRALHGFIAGDITPEDYMPKNLGVMEGDKYVRLSSGTYILDTEGNYIGYMPNTRGYARCIYYGCGYVSLNDVSAYLLAFGSLPANSNYGTASLNRSEALEKWGEYARINNQNFSGDTTRYPYEPLLPNIMGRGSIKYTETDFGTKGNYKYQFYNKREQTLDPYNDGEYINRGICRFVFVSDIKVTSIDDRYVFYTYNHYNDFQEYLNYDDGFGIRFGCESAGNLPCSSRNDYDDSFTTSTEYQAPVTRQFLFFV
jgi:hypothetical protein